MKTNSWLVLGLAAGAGVAGFVIGRQVTQNNVVRTLAAQAEAARLAAIRAGTIAPPMPMAVRP